MPTHDSRSLRPADQKSAASTVPSSANPVCRSSTRCRVAVLHRCSVARQVTGLSRHRATQPLVADLQRRHYPTHAEPEQHHQVQVLNPRVRGSSPWRRTRNWSLTCTYAVGKIIRLSTVDVPVLERCSLAGTGAGVKSAGSPGSSDRDGGRPRPVLERCSAPRSRSWSYQGRRWRLLWPGQSSSRRSFDSTPVDCTDRAGATLALLGERCSPPRKGGRGRPPLATRRTTCGNGRAADREVGRRRGVTALSGRVCCVGRGRALAVGAGPASCTGGSTSSRPSPRPPVVVRRVPVPTGGDHGRGRLVPALEPVLPRCRGAAGRTRHRGRPRLGVPVGAAVHPHCLRSPRSGVGGTRVASWTTRPRDGC